MKTDLLLHDSNALRKTIVLKDAKAAVKLANHILNSALNQASPPLIMEYEHGQYELLVRVEG